MAPWVHRHSLLLAKQNRDSDHDRARDAVSAGDVLPLQQILRCLAGVIRAGCWWLRTTRTWPGNCRPH
ncbi:MAG: hypothetical protein CMM23_08195 [Rhodospirillaceae bacterium]|nr:hypothetical protein [Rhodospirillaceae bacterium]